MIFSSIIETSFSWTTKWDCIFLLNVELDGASPGKRCLKSFWIFANSLIRPSGERNRAALRPGPVRVKGRKGYLCGTISPLEHNRGKVVGWPLPQSVAAECAPQPDSCFPSYCWSPGTGAEWAGVNCTHPPPHRTNSLEHVLPCTPLLPSDLDEHAFWKKGGGWALWKCSIRR